MKIGETRREIKLRGHLLALLREIHLEPLPPEQYWTERRFIYGTSPHGLAGLGMSLWYTHRARRASRDLAELLSDADPGLGNNLKSTMNTVFDYIESICLDARYFDANPVYLGGRGTLHDALPRDRIGSVSQTILVELRERLLAKVCMWLVIYPLRRVTAPTQQLSPVHSFGLIPVEDEGAWTNAIAGFANFRGWRHREFAYGKADNGPCTWLLFRAEGACDSARRKAAMAMREVIGVLFAHLFAEDVGSITHSMADPAIYAAQAPYDDAHPGTGLSISPVGAILPPLIDDVLVKEHVLQSTNEWFAKCDALDAEHAQRGRRAAQFCQYALVADELERFLFFFFALDALFGERYGVERSILTGLEQTLGPPVVQQQFAELFDLRSRLVHGGCTTIEDWTGFRRYLQRFDMDPRTHLQGLALNALRRYVDHASPSA